MSQICQDMVCKDLCIYLYNIIITTANYEEHEAAQKKVLLPLLEQKDLRKEYKYEFFTP